MIILCDVIIHFFTLVHNIKIYNIWFMSYVKSNSSQNTFICVIQ